MSSRTWWSRRQQAAALTRLLMDSGDMTPLAARRIVLLVETWADDDTEPQP